MEAIGEHLNKMRVVESVPYSFIKHKTGNEPIKVRWEDTLKTSGIHRSKLVAKDRWEDTLKTSGIHRSKLVAKEFRRGSKFDGFTNFSARWQQLNGTKLHGLDRGTREQFRDRDDAHRHSQRVTFTLQAKKRNMLSCDLRCGAKNIPSMNGSECRYTALVIQKQTERMRTPTYCKNHVHVHSTHE